MTDDNWQHRSEKMKCATCMWFVTKEISTPTGSMTVSNIGRCRRRSPGLGGWPVVFNTDWCGDHKLDEKRGQ